MTESKTDLYNKLMKDYKYSVAESVGASVTLVLLIALGFKVFNIVKFTNKWLLSMMVCLNLSVLSLIVFSSLNANFKYNRMMHIQDEKPFKDDTSAIVDKISHILGPALFSIGMQINLRNWVQYLLKIQEMINAAPTKMRFKVLDGVSLFIIMLKVTIIIGFSYFYFPQSQRIHGEIFDKLTMFYAIDFTVQGLAFLVTEVAMIISIKNYFHYFYRNNKNLLIFASIFLSVPILVRGIIDCLRRLDPENIGNFFKTNHIEFHVIFDLPPIMFQYLSLIFGFIRYRNEQTSRQKQEENVDRAGTIFQSLHSASVCDLDSQRSMYFDPPFMAADIEDRFDFVEEHPNENDERESIMKSKNKLILSGGFALQTQDDESLQATQIDNSRSESTINQD